MSEPHLLCYDMGRGVTAFSTTRCQGYSEGKYGAFNINEWCGDNELHVRANREALCSSMQIPSSALLVPHQVHGTEVRVVDEPLLQASEPQRRQMLEGVDALVTNIPQCCIGVSTADCIPVLLYDAAHTAVGAVHAGWRGTVKHIAAHTLQVMQRTYGTRASDVRAVIGPGISLAAFEVGDEVYEQFAEAFPHHPEVCARYAKWHIDLWRCNRLDLESRGVPASHIHEAGICTYGHTEEFFSARRLGVSSGRIYTGIMLHNLKI